MQQEASLEQRNEERVWGEVGSREEMNDEMEQCTE